MIHDQDIEKVGTKLNELDKKAHSVSLAKSIYGLFTCLIQILKAFLFFIKESILFFLSQPVIRLISILHKTIYRGLTSSVPPKDNGSWYIQIWINSAFLMIAYNAIPYKIGLYKYFERGASQRARE